MSYLGPYQVGGVGTVPPRTPCPRQFITVFGPLSGEWSGDCTTPNPLPRAFLKVDKAPFRGRAGVGTTPIPPTLGYLLQ